MPQIITRPRKRFEKPRETNYDGDKQYDNLRRYVMEKIRDMEAITC